MAEETKNLDDIITMKDIYDARESMKNSGIIEKTRRICSSNRGWGK